jgi:hypothetical protein
MDTANSNSINLERPQIRQRGKESPDHNPKDFEYRHVIGKLLFLEKSTRPDISCAVHQCARHCANPKIHWEQKIKV